MELDEEISKTKMFQAIQLKGYTDNSIKKIKEMGYEISNAYKSCYIAEFSNDNSDKLYEFIEQDEDIVCNIYDNYFFFKLLNSHYILRNERTVGKVCGIDIVDDGKIDYDIIVKLKLMFNNYELREYAECCRENNITIKYIEVLTFRGIWLRINNNGVMVINFKRLDSVLHWTRGPMRAATEGIFFDEMEYATQGFGERFDHGDVSKLDKLFFRLSSYEKKQLDMDYMFSAANLSSMESAESILKRIVASGYAKKREFLYCNNCHNIYRELDRSIEELPLKDECDLCEAEKIFDEFDIVNRYKILF